MADRFDLINFSKSVTTTLGGTAANVNIDANTLFIDGTNNRVGVGTNAPGEQLQVSGGNFSVLGASGSSFTGLINQNNGATNTAYRGLFYDGRNENGVAVANMLVDVNADGSSGWVWSTTPSGSRLIDRRVDRMRITSGGDLQFNSGYGSVATAFGCRAWVNFNGTGTVAIRASGNISSITDLGVGDYRLNLTNAMPDLNYCVICTKQNVSTNLDSVGSDDSVNRTLGSVRVVSVENNALADSFNYNCAVFR